jgi:putative peptide zinc metalloprotease protein
MNLTRVLKVALPEIPARRLQERYPEKPPGAVFKEHIEDGERVVRVVVPSQNAMFRFPPQSWELIQYFDGLRSYQDIAREYSANVGQLHSAEEIREFADSIDALDFWQKTQQEKNIQLLQRSAEERKRLANSRKNRFGDLSEIVFPAVNPDKFVTWWYGKTSFVYTWWFTALTLLAFTIAAAITVVHWSEIGRDTWEFFNFTHKTWGDVLLFYVLALFALCWHELGHAHACKHYGGRVPEMGFLLIYLTPAFYTDTTEGFVLGTRYQRLIIAVAGAWAELIVCAIATPLWWGTPPGSTVHSAAYLLILMTGIAGLLINWNPLMKLDGYHMLCEIVGISELKETSTAYVSAWVKRHIFGLPVEVPYVPKRRRLGFAVYAISSGVYSYTVLYILASFVGNVFRSFNPEWSFIPELGTAGLIFRSRIQSLVNFMKFFYLDKKDRILAILHNWQGRMALAGIAVFLLLPLWHESASGQFQLEPGKLTIIRNAVPGKVQEIFPREGDSVAAGDRIARLTNVSLQSRQAQAGSEHEVAEKKVYQASLNYSGLGEALGDRDRIAKHLESTNLQVGSLEIRSPLSGVILTPRVEDSIGRFLPEGAVIAEVGDLQTLKARVFVSEYEIQMVRIGSPARLAVDRIAGRFDARVTDMGVAASDFDSFSGNPDQFKGLSLHNFYKVDLYIQNSDGRLQPGMTGFARVYGARRSAARLMWQNASRFVGRKFW